MRHGIQRAGHAALPVLFMVVGMGSAILFYLGNFWPGTPPGLVVVPVLCCLAVATEWLTATFGQDMQDAITARRGRCLPVGRALVASSVSTFIFAQASLGLWAPRGATDKTLWAWILAVGIFGSQFILKLTPERAKAPHSLVNVALAIEQWAPEASIGEQARLAGKVFEAVAGSVQPAAPAGQRTIAVLPAGTLEASEGPLPAREPAEEGTGVQPGFFRRGWQWFRGGQRQAPAADAGGRAGAGA
jgi:hypothetical protein